MTHSAAPPEPRLDAQDRALVATLVAGVMLPLLDTTLVNLSLSSMGVALNAPLDRMQWVVAGYTLSAAAAVPLCAWITQRLGTRRLWLLCLWLFLGGASLAALAPSITSLIVARVFQGIATGLLLPTMQTIVVSQVGREKARLALAAASIPSVLVPIFGPVIGGVFMQYLGWRLLFWAHVPICIIAIVMASRRLPETCQHARESLDVTGALLLLPGLVSVIYGLSVFGRSNAGTLSGLLGTGLMLLIAFGWHARKKGQSTIVDLSILTARSTRAAYFMLFFSSIAYYGGILLFPLYLIQAGGYAPTSAGLIVAVHGMGILLARRRLPHASRRWGDRLVATAAIATALVGSGILLTPWVLPHPVLIAAGMLLRGAGLGVLTLLSMSGSYHGLQTAQVSHASSLSRIATHLGATIGATTVAGLAADAVIASGSDASGYVVTQLALIGVLLACGASCRHLPSGVAVPAPEERGGFATGARQRR